MLRLIIGVCVLFICIGCISCSKNTDADAGATPKNWARISAIRQKHVVISGTDSIITLKEIAQASFFADPANLTVLTDAGSLSINGTNLSQDGSHHYYYEGNDLQYDSKIEWAGGGNSSWAVFSYKDSIVFPDYFGPMPDVVDKANGFTMQLDSSTVANADSVRISVDDANHAPVMKTFYARAGQVTIPAADLAILNTVTDQTAVIAIMPYHGINRVYRNKGYFFTKERRLYRSVNIN